MLKELRQKDKAVRQSYAFWAAFAITGVIAGVWSLSLSAKFNETHFFSAEEDNDGAFAQFLDKTKSDVASVWDSFNEPTASSTSSEESASTTNDLNTKEASSTAWSKETIINEKSNKKVLIATSSKSQTGE